MHEKARYVKKIVSGFLWLRMEGMNQIHIPLCILPFPTLLTLCILAPSLHVSHAK